MRVETIKFFNAWDTGRNYGKSRPSSVRQKMWKRRVSPITVREFLVEPCATCPDRHDTDKIIRNISVTPRFTTRTKRSKPKKFNWTIFLLLQISNPWRNWVSFSSMRATSARWGFGVSPWNVFKRTYHLLWFWIDESWLVPSTAAAPSHLRWCTYIQYSGWIFREFSFHI